MESSSQNLTSNLSEQAYSIGDKLNELASKLESTKLEELASQASTLGEKIVLITQSSNGSVDPLVFGITVLVLSCFIGYYVVWAVTPALHSPLMGVTNAISSVIIVGALIAAGPEEINFSTLMGFFAIILASINIFGGFIVTQRMLSMFKRKPNSGSKK